MRTRPSTTELKKELKRVDNHNKNILRSSVIVGIIVVASAVAVLLAYLVMPVFRVYGSSMEPLLKQNDICISLNGSKYSKGDIVAFYFDNKILAKRVVGEPGDWIDIDKDGNIYVNSEIVDEPYITVKSYGNCNIDLPYQVPEDSYFLVGDNREESVDSRNKEMGSIRTDKIIGRLTLVVWPLRDIRIIG